MTKTPKMTQEQIVEETIAWYGADPVGRRSMKSNGACYYAMTRKKRCAVGRCMTIKNAQATDDRLKWRGRGTSVVAISNLETLLKPRYRGHPLMFWRDLQKLHDNSFHWGKRGLSEIGVNFVKANWPKVTIS